MAEPTLKKIQEDKERLDNECNLKCEKVIELLDVILSNSEPENLFEIKQNKKRKNVKKV